MQFCFKLLVRDLSLGSEIFKLNKYSVYCSPEVASAQISKEDAQNFLQTGLPLKQWNKISFIFIISEVSAKILIVLC